MTQRAIRCVLMRGGTSRGPFFKASDLPSDPALRDKVLLRVMGSPDSRQIDGIGGATTVTSKVAIISRSDRSDADIDYLFAQVDIEQPIVDTGPTCGNMLSGIAPFAIEEGLFPAQNNQTTVRIHNVNTNSIIHATIQTPNRQVYYEGDYAIHGVPGTGSPILLRFFQIEGSKTGQLLPTGNIRDEIEGIEVTCIDVAMPMVIARADAFGKTGYETRDELNADKGFIERFERLRRIAGKKMGLGDVGKSVMPKFAIVSPPRDDGHFTSRYFTPWSCHPTYAVSGSMCISSCAALPGSILADVMRRDERFPKLCRIEHPVGTIDVKLDIASKNEQFKVISAGVLRTARRLFAGDVYVPSAVWK